jgi:ribose 5-phosphate isomerase B
MQVFIGADHNGFTLKGELIAFLRHEGYAVQDVGDAKLQPEDDFPQFASQLVHAMQANGLDDSRGILLCGSGQGMCMAANRFKGIRAALGYDAESVRSSRNDDDSNVLCLPADDLATAQAELLIKLWLDTPFAAAPRFIRRIKELDRL